jgi:hypothetical protein
MRVCLAGWLVLGRLSDFSHRVAGSGSLEGAETSRLACTLVVGARLPALQHQVALVICSLVAVVLLPEVVG